MLDGHRFLFTEREDQTVLIQLSGNLARNEALGLVLSGTVAPFSPILLAFTWTQSSEALQNLTIFL